MAIMTVMIATSSASELQHLRAALATDPGLRLAAQCPGLMETFNAVEHSPPDILLIARDLTLSPEFELMRALFEALDVRWLVVDRSAATPPRQKDDRSHVSRGSAGDLFTLVADGPTTGLLRQIHTVISSARRATGSRAVPQLIPGRPPGKVVLLGSSTGGVDALQTILSDYPADCPPTVIVQHTGKGFGQGLVQLLSLRCRARVVGCEDGLEVTPGTVCIAAGLPGHATFSGFNPLRMAISAGEPMAGDTPSIDRLFLSAVPIARRVSAAVLTGMGSDGASGLLALRKAGATTIAQDAATSVVFGMPRVAFESGGVQRQLRLGQIGPALLQQSRVTA